MYSDWDGFKRAPLESFEECPGHTHSLVFAICVQGDGDGDGHSSALTCSVFVCLRAVCCVSHHLYR